MNAKFLHLRNSFQSHHYFSPSAQHQWLITTSTHMHKALSTLLRKESQWLTHEVFDLIEHWLWCFPWSCLRNSWWNKSLICLHLNSFQLQWCSFLCLTYPAPPSKHKQVVWCSWDHALWYISIVKPTRCTIFQFTEYHSACFGLSFRPSSGVQDCTYSIRYMSHRFVDYLLVGTRSCAP
jgi:hypothetical protein